MLTAKPDKVAIIGAGASGLTAARQAVNYGFEPVIFEKTGHLGGIWNYSDDPEDRSVSFSTTMLHSKELSAFSDFPPLDKFGTFMHHSEVLEYLNSYVDHFDLRKFIRFECCVTSVKRSDDWKETGNWILDYQGSNEKETTEVFKAVLICTGMYSKPSRPFEYRMEDQYQGKIVHSSQVKHVNGFKDKVVVLVGFGNSAVQLATDLAPIAKQVYLSTRRGSWLIPTLTSSSEPWDLTFNSRFNASGRKYLPKVIQNYLWEAELNGKFDHVSAGIQPDHRFLAANLTFSKNGFIDHLVSQRIKIKPNLLSFTKTGVELVDKTIIDYVDQVIFCTGYQFDFNFIENGKLIFVRENDFHLYKHMFLPELQEIAKHSNFAVLGHIQPTGPFFPVVEMQARFFFDVLSEKYDLKSPFLMKSSLEKRRCQISIEYVKTKRHTQIEDYTEYMDDLASKIGAKPSIIQLFKENPKLGLKCVFGPNLPYQYRLIGEHTWDDAKSAILTSNQRIHPLGSSRYFKLWQLYFFAIVVIFLWSHFWL